MRLKRIIIALGVLALSACGGVDGDQTGQGGGKGEVTGDPIGVTGGSARGHQSPGSPTRTCTGFTLCVGKLDYSVSCVKLEQVFGKYGEVLSCKVIYDKFTGKSKGFGYIELCTAEQGRAAIAALNKTELAGHDIVVGESN
ncbi:MAG: hypothetical protein H6707_04150 [Deltaproteobacteria bacterium]|nr:hypothetical protein [Deltaproteobacteria bacterium]